MSTWTLISSRQAQKDAKKLASSGSCGCGRATSNQRSVSPVPFGGAVGVGVTWVLARQYGHASTDRSWSPRVSPEASARSLIVAALAPVAERARRA